MIGDGMSLYSSRIEKKDYLVPLIIANRNVLRLNSNQKPERLIAFKIIFFQPNKKL